MRLTNEEFLASKISLRSRIFSLYAGASPGRIHSVIKPSVLFMRLVWVND